MHPSRLVIYKHEVGTGDHGRLRTESPGDEVASWNNPHNDAHNHCDVTFATFHVARREEGGEEAVEAGGDQREYGDQEWQPADETCENQETTNFFKGQRSLVVEREIFSAGGRCFVQSFRCKVNGWNESVLTNLN